MILSLFERIKKLIRKIIGHSICFYCKQNEGKAFFCDACLSSFPFPVPLLLKKTKLIIYSLGRYDGFLRFVVNQKYRKNPLAYYALQDKIIELFKIYQLQDSFDIILPVPKSSSSRVAHGFNPAEIIARIISKKFCKEIFLSVYTKQYKTRQVGLKNEERSRNKKNIFFISTSDSIILENKKILIVDDVYTTGATIEAMRDTLKKISCCSAMVFVLAR
jgi:competence protein ComFC